MGPVTGVGSVLLCVLGCSVMSDSLTVTHQALLYIGFFRQEYWNGLSCPSSRGFSQPRDQTQLSCISCVAGGIFMCLIEREQHASERTRPWDLAAR